MQPVSARPARPDRHELIADGIVHGVGVAFALVGVSILIFYATLFRPGAEVAAASVYGVTLVFALAVSFSYNLWPHGRVKAVLRRMDHSAIFLLIAATYTPFLVKSADHDAAVTMLFVIWGVAALGVTLKCVFPGRYDRAAILLYLAAGWSGLSVVGPVSASVPAASMVLIVAGGVIYSAGVIFHVWERLRFQTAIWHTFVVAAAAVHYSAVLLAFSAG